MASLFLLCYMYEWTYLPNPYLPCKLIGYPRLCVVWQLSEECTKIASSLLPGKPLLEYYALPCTKLFIFATLGVIVAFRAKMVSPRYSGDCLYCQEYIRNIVH